MMETKEMPGRCIFRHYWRPWVHYRESGTCILGRLYPKAVQGDQVPYSELRQQRTCRRCSKMQDELVYGS